jgi:hypothetical protein
MIIQQLQLYSNYNYNKITSVAKVYTKLKLKHEFIIEIRCCEVGYSLRYCFWLVLTEGLD